MTDEVSLDKVALIAVLNALQRMQGALLQGDVRRAAGEADLAWVLLPLSVRVKFPVRPSEALEAKAAQELPSEEALSQMEQFRRASAFAVDAYREGLRRKLAERVLWAFAAECVAEMDAQGLYVSPAGKGRVVPTDERGATEQPPTKGLPTTLRRE